MPARWGGGSGGTRDDGEHYAAIDRPVRWSLRTDMPGPREGSQFDPSRRGGLLLTYAHFKQMKKELTSGNEDVPRTWNIPCEIAGRNRETLLHEDTHCYWLSAIFVL